MPRTIANGKPATKSFVRPATLDDLLAREPRREVVPIHLKEAEFRAYEEAAKAVALTDTPETRKALEDAEAALAATTVTVTLQEIPRPDYDALISAHPATEEQDKLHRERVGIPAPYDTDNFPLALVAASAVEPAMSEEQVRSVWEAWPFHELSRLWQAALKVNSQSRNVAGFLAGSNGTRN